MTEQLNRDRQLGPPKSAAGRLALTLPKVLGTLLGAHLAASGLTAAHGDVLVFTSPRGTPLDYSRWRQRVWVLAVNAVGLSGVTFHDLRRANATALVLDGVDLKTAEARLGHSDPRLTLAVYTQATTEADKAAWSLKVTCARPRTFGMPLGVSAVNRIHPPKRPGRLALHTRCTDVVQAMAMVQAIVV